MFQKTLRDLIISFTKEHKEFVYINAWNEWGEGAYLELDEDNKYTYLTTVKSATMEVKANFKKYYDTAYVLEDVTMTGLKPELVWAAYEGDNYQCIDTGTDSDICYIFFSSNGLYYPDEKEVFESEIIQKDRYEWKWVVNHSGIPEKAGRVIYVRDVFKDWYSMGISKTVNTLDKTLDLLKRLTEGYRIVTVGSSAGGYMAVLAAVSLQAAWCINFSGQYRVRPNVQEEYRDLSTILQDYHGVIFYFVPIKSEQDLEQYELVKNIASIKAFLFTGKKHADTMLTGNLQYVIDKNADELLLLHEHYKDREIDKFKFLFDSVPLSGIIRIAPKEITGFVKRRLGLER